MVIHALCSICIFDQVVYIKNRFTAPTDAGWRDVIINGYFPQFDFVHVVEIQLQLGCIVPIRRCMGGHHIYGRMRALNEAFEVVHGPHWKKKFVKPVEPEEAKSQPQ